MPWPDTNQSLQPALSPNLQPHFEFDARYTMVQFNTGVDNDPADYWKLSRPKIGAERLRRYLRRSNFRAITSADKDRLLFLYSRLQRNLLSYDHYLKWKLKEFCDGRGFVVDKNARKVDMIAILEAADERPKFKRFLDLPPELRNRIYTMHFESFPALRLPITPPVTRVSRQLRQETLILFYQTCKVEIALSLHSTRSGLRPRLAQGKPIGFTRHTKRIFSHFPEQYLGMLRRFLIEGVANASPAECVDTGWYVDLGSGRKQVYVTPGWARAARRNVPKEFEVGRRKVQTMIKTEMKAIMAREGQSRLQRGDLEEFRRMFAP